MKFSNNSIFHILVSIPVKSNPQFFPEIIKDLNREAELSLRFQYILSINAAIYEPEKSIDLVPRNIKIGRRMVYLALSIFAVQTMQVALQQQQKFNQ